MTDRTISFTLRAEYDQAVKGLEKVSKSAGEAGKAVEKAGDQMQAASRRQADAAGQLKVAETRLQEVKRKNADDSSKVAAAEEAVARARRQNEEATKRATLAEKAYGKAAEEASRKQSKGGFSGLLQQAKENEQAWGAAGRALSVFGGAIVGIGAAAAKTGISYNQLQQSSRAAMTTLMGGAKEANAQMDKLDDFARNSPFSKATFIQAQQRLIGFGIEAKKVIPYLDAIQNSVAATGGSDVQIDALVESMAKIHATGKITAGDLMELGNRGVDAATLIGSAMGKTGADIRADITAGALGADQALDAMVQGMNDKFSGAAANVKNTFAGALDRVKAAWRDLSADMAEPLVGKYGGGLAVEGLNKVADAMRQFQSLPTPIKATSGALTGLVGAASLGVGGFMALAPRIVDTREAFKTLAGQKGVIGGTAKAINTVGDAAYANKGKIAGLIGIITTMSAVAAIAAEQSQKDARKIDPTVTLKAIQTVNWDQINAQFQGITKTGNESFTAVNDFGSALDRIFSPQMNDNINDFLTSWNPIQGGAEQVRDAFHEVGEQMKEAADAGNVENTVKMFARMTREAQDHNVTAQQLLDLMPEYKRGLEDMARDAGMKVDGDTAMKIATGKVTQSMIDQAKAAGGNSEALSKVTGVSAEAAKAQEKFYDSVVKTTDSFIDWSKGVKEGKTSVDSYMKSMKEQVKNQEEWVDNLILLQARGMSSDAIERLRAMGPKGYGLVAEYAKGASSKIAEYNGLVSQSGENAANAAGVATEGIKKVPKRTLTIMEGDAKDLKKEIKDGKARIKELEKKPATKQVKGEISDLKDKVADAQVLLDGIQDKTVQIKLQQVVVGGAQAGAALGGTDELPSPQVRRAKPMKKRAAGGPVWGEGTATSDSILAALSNGENVWDAKAVQGAGGMAAVERMRLLAQKGQLPKFAKGGPVSRAEKSVQEAERELTRARRAKSDASKSNKRSAELRVRRAQDDLKSARASLKSAKASDSAAKKAEAERKKREQEEKERRARVSDLKRETRTDLRRGNYQDQVTSGLSGAYSVVDRLGDLSRNKDLSKGQRRTAGAASSKYETSLRRLYDTQSKLEKSQERASANVEKANKRLDAANDKLSKAKSHLEDMQSIQKGVSDNLLKDRTIDFGDYDRMEGGVWKHDSGVKGATRRMSVDVGKMKAFAQKMNKLQKAGLPVDVLQDIAGMGLEDGSKAADAFLNASKADQKSYISTWKEYEKYSMQAGKYVTNAAAPGGLDKAQADVSAAQSKVNAEKIGVATAEGIVKGLERQQKSITKAVEKIAKSIDKTFRKTLGIHSPSTVLADAGVWTGQGAIDGLLSMLAGAEDASQQLAQAMVPDLSSMSFSAPTVTTPTVAADPMSTGSSSGGMGMPDVTAGVAGAAGGDEATQAVLDAEQVVRDAYAAMTATTTDGMTTMQSAVNTSMLAMLADTQTNQTGMQSKTKGALDSMSALTTARYESMRATTADKLARMRDDTTAKQESMRATVSDKTERMRATSSEKFESMRATGSDKSDKLRSSVDSHIGSMRDTVSGHVASMRSHSDAGFDRMESHGKAAAKGLREGAGAQMGHMPGEAGNNLNRVLGIFGKFASSINGSFGEVGVKLNSPAKLKYASGGTLPGHTPGRDIYRFQDQYGRELHLGGGESIMTTRFTDAVGPDWVAGANRAAEVGGRQGVFNYMNRGGESFDNIGRFAAGGTLRNLDKAKRFAQSQDGKPYIWGGAGPRGYDCSGFQSAIINVLLGRNPYRRLFATGSSGGATWGPLVKGKGTYTAGVYHGHTSGTLDGVNVESTTGHGGGRTGVKYGHGARSATNPMFRWQYKLPEDKGMFVPGDDSVQAAVIPKFLTDAGIKSFPSDMKKAFEKASAFHMAKARKSVAGDIAALPEFYQGLANGTLDKAKPGITKKATEYSKNMSYSGGANANAESWRGMVAQALQMSGIGGGRSDENLWLKQIMTESTGNPRLVQSSALKDINVLRGDPARGLVQVPGVTWKDFGKGMGSFIPNVYDPLKNLIVGMRAADAQHKPDWRRVIGKGHGYADGTENAEAGLALTGEDGPELLRRRASDQFWSIVGQDAPELLRFRGGEQVMSTPETRAVIPNSQIQAAASGGSAPIDYDRLGTVLADQLARHPQIIQNVDSSKLTTREVAAEAVQALTDRAALYTANI
jgi:tape measure domain-containing protein